MLPGTQPVPAVAEFVGQLLAEALGILMWTSVAGLRRGSLVIGLREIAMNLRQCRNHVIL